MADHGFQRFARNSGFGQRQPSGTAQGIEALSGLVDVLLNARAQEAVNAFRSKQLENETRRIASLATLQEAQADDIPKRREADAGKRERREDTQAIFKSAIEGFDDTPRKQAIEGLINTGDFSSAASQIASVVKARKGAKLSFSDLTNSLSQLRQARDVLESSDVVTDDDLRSIDKSILRTVRAITDRVPKARGQEREVILQGILDQILSESPGLSREDSLKELRKQAVEQGVKGFD